jgi:hypothetical protein
MEAKFDDAGREVTVREMSWAANWHSEFYRLED